MGDRRKQIALKVLALLRANRLLTFQVVQAGQSHGDRHLLAYRRKQTHIGGSEMPCGATAHEESANRAPIQEEWHASDGRYL